jgi:dihydrofolate reductase
MAELVFGMNQSLDGYVDHSAFAPSPTLFRHFIEEARAQAGSLYGRKMYEIMRYWDDDHPEWDAEQHAFAAAWRAQPKWVVSRSSKSVGPNASLVEDDLEGAIRELKAERDGEIEVAGPDVAHGLTRLGLIDEYRIYLHPVVLGHGTPYFAGPRPPLRLVAHARVAEDVIKVDVRSCLISRLAGWRSVLNSGGHMAIEVRPATVFGDSIVHRPWRSTELALQSFFVADTSTHRTPSFPSWSAITVSEGALLSSTTVPPAARTAAIRRSATSAAT